MNIMIEKQATALMLVKSSRLCMSLNLSNHSVISTILVLLTPGFSQVTTVRPRLKPFQRFQLARPNR
jgi:hypothetical protein